ncbi:minor tail protein [Arthrobacter phage Mufasa8]|uniref:Minor tail protein n=1 Tax=Arthrobacter phage Mufasa8 TaxID=2656526 RepID=A0A649VN61_9CAUD|nr:minor tail protein [Arthrobacter phage Mufasa8]QGJ93469.1 minor tail protein [Arthrobacter phage Mufasa8]
MVNAVLGPEYDLGTRIKRIEGILAALATQPMLLNASTGQTGGKGLLTDAGGLHVFSASGTEVTRINTDDGGMWIYSDVGQLGLNAGAVSGNTVPTISWITTDGGGVQTYGATMLQSYNEWLLYGPKTSTNSGSQTVISAKDTGGWMKAYGTSGGGAAYLNVSYAGTFYLGNWAATCGVYTTSSTGPVLVIGGLTVSGTKNFVMDHPTKPGWSLKHASTESPHNGVEYWGSGTLDENGELLVNLPEYFEALTYERDRNVQLTGVGRVTTPLGASRISGNAFTAYGDPGQEFDWLVKAVRKSTNPDEPIDFIVEGPKETMAPPPPPQDEGTEKAGPPAPPPPIFNEPVPEAPYV